MNRINEGVLPVFQFTPRDIEGAIEDRKPLWILVFSNSHCMSSTSPSLGTGRLMKFMDLTHLIATHGIDLDDYLVSSPNPSDIFDLE